MDKGTPFFSRNTKNHSLANHALRISIFRYTTLQYK
jgi:hypothetical protein